MLQTIIHQRGTNPLVPIVGVHGTGGSGRDTQRLLKTPIERWFRQDALLVCPTFETPYQYLLPDADSRLIMRLDRLNKKHRLNDRMLMYGFSGGAQFCHRFAMRHPHRVAACVALAAGCWTDPDGQAHGMQVDEAWFDRPPWDDPAITRSMKTPAADPQALCSIRWVIGCGTRDHPSRYTSAARFHRALLDLGAESTWLEWDGAHTDPPPAIFEQIMAYLNVSVG